MAAKEILDFFYVNTAHVNPGCNPTLLTFSRMKNTTLIPDRHMHTYLELFYIESGTGIFLCGDERILLRAHTLLLVNASVIHMQFSEDPEAPLVYYNFAIGDASLSELVGRDSEEEFFVQYMEETDNAVYQRILLLMKELKNQEDFYRIRSTGLFYEIFAEVCRILLPSKETGMQEESVLQNARKYIQNHYFREITLEELARMSYMSTTSFLHRFSRMYQISPIRYLIMVRLENAKHLLLRSDDSISAIISKVGFHDQAYFSKVFKKTEGLTPTEYRQKYKRNLISEIP